MRQLRLFALTLLFASAASAGPAITSITPVEGSESGGTQVVIRGHDFTNSATVFFGNVQAPTIGFVSSSELHAQTPAHAPGAVPVKVLQPDGEFTQPNGFTYKKDPFTMTPKSGPSLGGTVVTIKGAFGSWPYAIIFGQTYVPTWRTAADTVVAISPPGEPGSNVPITIWEYDVAIPTSMVFTYETGPTDDMERMLLPVLVPPANGAFGSRFVTELRSYNRSISAAASIQGLSHICTSPVCAAVVPDPTRDSIEVAPQDDVAPFEVVYNGTPGRFVWIPKDQAEHLWLNMRVYDETRSAQNFGTELPVVRDRELFRGEPIVFTDVPTDQRFRNTLRIYAESAITVRVDITNGTDYVSHRDITLQPSRSRFDPAYAQIGDLPSGAGAIRVKIIPPEPGFPGFYTPMWAFVSVTNNDTQLITTIRP